MLIVDMPMPKGCYFCPMSATYPTDWYCIAHDDSKSIDGCAPMKERPSWCPIKGELVRCGECGQKKTQGNGVKFCGLHGLHYGMIITDDWFCADGERKDGEHE